MNANENSQIHLKTKNNPKSSEKSNASVPDNRIQVRYFICIVHGDDGEPLTQYSSFDAHILSKFYNQNVIIHTVSADGFLEKVTKQHTQQSLLVLMLCTITLTISRQKFK